jgi:hypothetical protein
MAYPRGGGAGKGRSGFGWQLDRNEESRRKQVVLARFVHDPKERMPFGRRILEHPVDLARLEGSTVAAVAHAENVATS